MSLNTSASSSRIRSTTIKLKRGDTWKAVFTWTTTPVIDGVAQPVEPVDLTDCSARLQVRTTNVNRTLLLSASTDTGELVIDGTAGKITLRIEDTVTDDLIVGTHDVDLEVTFPDNTRISTKTFKLEVEEDITR